MTPPNKVERVSRMMMVPLADMHVSPVAQRRYNRAQAESYAADLKLESLGFPVLNKRDGRWYIIDGQHRVQALRMADFGEYKLECECYFGLSEAEEADLFLERNNRRTVTPFDRFRIALTAQRATELAVRDAVELTGLRVAKGSRDGNVSAVAALLSIYENGGAVMLSRTLAILRDAYGAIHVSLSSEMIRGLGLVCQRYNGDMDDEAVTVKLSSASLQTLLATASVLKRQTGRRGDECIAAAVVELVNRGRGGRKLTPWRF